MSFIDFDAPTNFKPRKRQELDLSDDDNNNDNEDNINDIFNSINDDEASSLNQNNNVDWGLNENDNDDNDDEKPKKRVLPKIDHERLLSNSNGLPALMNSSKNWKFKGKGNEREDLNTLISYYQLWSHKLYPKTKFIDNINRVEKLCHSQRLNYALKGWKEGVVEESQDRRESENIFEREESLFRSPSPPRNNSQSSKDVNDDVNNANSDVVNDKERNDDIRDQLEIEALENLENELGQF